MAKAIHFKRGGRTACGQKIGGRQFTDKPAEVNCVRCIETRLYRMEVSPFAPLNKAIVKAATDIRKALCPCLRRGEGCNAYSVIEAAPYYICKHTGLDAYVPRTGGDVGDVQIMGLIE